jgi:cell shape-determining protein MreC
MRQIYHRQNNKRKRNYYSNILIVIILIVIIEVSFNPIASIGRGTSNVFSNPIHSISRGIDTVFKVVTGKSGVLIEENEDLKSEIVRLNKEIDSRDLLRSENESLRSICKIDSEGEKDFIISEVIARPPNIPYDTLRINKGSNDGIAIGKRVYVNDYHIGQVESLTNNQSIVSLIGNEGDISVSISGNEGILSPLKGLSYVGEFSSTSGILEGDTVALIDDMSNPFADVTYIEETINDPSIRVYVNIPIKLSSIRYVSIEK